MFILVVELHACFAKQTGFAPLLYVKLPKAVILVDTHVT
jgi:hypothetical protein